MKDGNMIDEKKRKKRKRKEKKNGTALHLLGIQVLFVQRP
jgi:hypothetical protein